MLSFNSTTKKPAATAAAASLTIFLLLTGLVVLAVVAATGHGGGCAAAATRRRATTARASICFCFVQRIEIGSNPVTKPNVEAQIHIYTQDDVKNGQINIHTQYVQKT
jgi:hypothetical protein